MKKILNFLSIFVVSVLVFSNVGPTFAQAIENKDSYLFSEETLSITDLDSEYVEAYEVKIVKDNEEYRVIESTENGEIFVTTLNKKTNIMSIYNKNDITSLTQIDLNNIQSKQEDTYFKKPTDINALASTLSEDTLSNYEYDITFSSPNKWVIYRPQPDNALKSFNKTVYNNSNHNNGALLTFKDNVDLINTAEITFITAASLSVLLACISAIVSAINAGLSYVGAAAALGLAGKALVTYLDLGRYISNAEYWYHQAN